MISLFVQICRFQAKPQDLPASKNLLMHCIAAATVSFMIRNIMLMDMSTAVMFSLLQSVMLGVCLYTFLMLFKKPVRWLQSASALYGCSALIVAMMLPIIAFSGPEAIFDATLDMTKIMVVVISLWYFLVTIFILKETLDIGKFAGFGMAFLMEVIIGSVMAGFTSLAGSPVS